MSFRYYAVTAKQPWAFLITKGVKQIENRDNGLSEEVFNQPVAVHVAAKPYKEPLRYQYYQLPCVQKSLKQIPETTQIATNNQKLDDFFSKTYRSITSIISISKTTRSIDPDYEQTSQLPFANIPVKAAFHWTVHTVYELQSPITNYSGFLGCYRMKDGNALKQIKLIVADEKIQSVLKLKLIESMQVKSTYISSWNAWDTLGLSLNAYRLLMYVNRMCHPVELLGLSNHHLFSREKMTKLSDVEQIKYMEMLFYESKSD
eukprot:338477_1